MAAVFPTDEPSRRASRVWLAFVGRAASDRSIADTQGILYRDFHAFLVAMLDQLSPDQARAALESAVEPRSSSELGDFPDAKPTIPPPRSG